MLELNEKFCDLNSDELCDTEGGFIITAVLVGAAIGAFSVGFTTGRAIGEAIRG